MSEPREIVPLTGLRGLAALWVLCFHALIFFRGVPGGAPDVLEWLARAGYLGVDVFFVLSGFVLAYNYAAARLHTSPRACAGFLWKRLARIYPVHLAALALLCVAVLALIACDIPYYRSSAFTPDGLVRSLTLTHAWQLPMQRSWNAVSWSISAEWAAYLAFPLIALAAAACNRAWQVLAGIVLLFVALHAAIAGGPFVYGMDYGLHRVAAEFSAGVLAHRLWVLRGGSSWAGGGLAAAVAVAVLVLGGAWLELDAGRLQALVWLPAAAVVLVYGLATARGGRLPALLASRAGVFLGCTSYSLYMVHGTVVRVVRSVLLENGDTAGLAEAWLAVAVTLGASLLLASWFYYRIETPARRWLVKRGGILTGTASAQPVAVPDAVTG